MIIYVIIYHIINNNNYNIIMSIKHNNNYNNIRRDRKEKEESMIYSIRTSKYILKLLRQEEKRKGIKI